MRPTLEEKRRQQKMNQKVLAQYAGVSVFYLSQLEKGKVNSSNVFAVISLCDRMDISIQDLVKAWGDFPYSDSNVCVVATARRLADICDALNCDISDIRFQSQRYPNLYATNECDR